MDKNVIINIEKISKKYKLYNKPADRLKETVHPFKKKYHKEFFALKNISFQIEKGETFGIIGKNGSGKSTLLKIITGVLSQTEGCIDIKGKVSALLELGAGFNPEYTGIENIYLQGTILGYAREDMEKKIKDISDFADIGEFLYQRVKTYSSGMFIRLAFSVAINVEPDILIIDEALSVGDIKFQQKCYRKIKDFQSNGGTILFVSHDLEAMANFCDRLIWLNDGEIKDEGSPKKITENYRSYMDYNTVAESDSTNSIKYSNEKTLIKEIPENNKSFGEGQAKITGIGLINTKSKKASNSKVFGGEEVSLLIKIYAFEEIYSPILGFILKDRLGNEIIIYNNIFADFAIPPFQKDESRIVKFIFQFPKIRNGTYSLTIALAEGTFSNHIQQHWIHDALIIEVVNKDVFANNQGILLLDNIKCELE